MSNPISYIRRAYRCRRCGRTFVVIGPFRNPFPPPQCSHVGTVKFEVEPPYPMYRTARPGPSR